MNQKGFAPLIIILLIIVSFVLGAVAWGMYLNANSSGNKQQASENSNNSQKASTSNTSSNNWTTYTNNTYGYSFKYPSDWILDTSQANGSTSAGSLLYGSSISITSGQYQMVFIYDVKATGRGDSLNITKTNNTSVNGVNLEEYYWSDYAANGKVNYQGIVIGQPNALQNKTDLPGQDSYFSNRGKRIAIRLTLANPTTESSSTSQAQAIEAFNQFLTTIQLP